MVKACVVNRPTRLRSLPGPHPESLQRTSIPPPLTGATPASTLTVVEVTCVICAAVKSARYVTPTCALVSWVTNRVAEVFAFQILYRYLDVIHNGGEGRPA